MYNSRAKSKQTTQFKKGSPGWIAQLVGASSCEPSLQVLFPVRAHTYAVGLIPSCSVYRGQPINVSLTSMFFYLPFFISKKSIKMCPQVRINKWAKDLNRHFSKGHIWMAYRCEKMLSITNHARSINENHNGM